jgi:hypothetical protein
VRVPRDLTEDERRLAVASLRTVGGIYDHVADFVERDHSAPPQSCAHCGGVISRSASWRASYWRHDATGLSTCLERGDWGLVAMADPDGALLVATPAALESAHD